MNPPCPDLSLASNLWGPLDDGIKRRIARYCAKPTPALWSDVQTIILSRDGWITLWQAVIAIDPTFPQTGRVTDQRGRVVEEWRRIPTPDQIAQAIAYATH